MGARVRLTPLTEAHAEPLFAAFSADTDGRGATYLPYGPFQSAGDLLSFATLRAAGPDRFYTVVTDRPVGFASYLRIAPDAGSIEIGNLYFSQHLQRTTEATEALSLMIGAAFAHGYRRVEWKCDALNAPSCRAAERLGFRFEGVFRQATVYKGRNRDTAWYAILDAEWPALAARHAAWLDPSNFDGDGRQRASLETIVS